MTRRAIPQRGQDSEESEVAAKETQVGMREEKKTVFEPPKMT